MSVRVRYAPSPTGLQHIGSLRTALFNYFFARSQGGTFILRVEDTDQTRFDPRALQDIYDTFDWIGIHWDEGPDVGGEYGPYIQSERFDLYKEHALRLVEEGKAYKCFCSAERLEKLREEQSKQKGGHQGYDRHCRNLSSTDVASKEAAGEPYVIRFKIPLEGETVISDRVLGETRRKHKDINPDPVLLKTDGFPTYHLANVVDDHHMGITHILRAQEWVSSAALHVLLYKAFGWEVPEFVHLPMVMGKDGSKLSKRHGSTSVIDFRNQGYLPEALVNYVTMVGWGYDESTEFFSIQDLERVFSDGKINKAPGVFDYKKLQWYNSQYIARTDENRLVDLCLPYLVDEGFITRDARGDVPSDQLELLQSVMPLAKERMKLLSDIPSVAGFLFRDFTLNGAGDLVQKKQNPEDTKKILEQIRDDFTTIADLDEEGFHDYFQNLAESLETGMGKVMMPLRIAITGSRATPPMADSIRLMGREKALSRLETAIGLL
ncbi:glutamate--tRNA ligase [Salinispira pacifica]|uniref:Glutamate--tRNA ligase n=1 Tax=Salinispira pacifica TaxID=1307761 RepID=V5WI00_9SPIO|nr:glutamate--tRNA ligase [Salinispira pacifica]AHC14796.1 Glutamyl-tRNA synthetase [Salinispira pacifica]